MGSPALDMAPPLPDSVKTQMGSSQPFAGMGDTVRAKASGMGPTPGGDAQGALKAQGDAIKKVLEQMIQASVAGKTFFSRAAQLIDQGMQMEAQKGPGSPASGEGRPSSSEGPAMGGMQPPPVAFQG